MVNSLFSILLLFTIFLIPYLLSFSRSKKICTVVQIRLHCRFKPIYFYFLCYLASLNSPVLGWKYYLRTTLIGLFQFLIIKKCFSWKDRLWDRNSFDILIRIGPLMLQSIFEAISMLDLCCYDNNKLLVYWNFEIFLLICFGRITDNL